MTTPLADLCRLSGAPAPRREDAGDHPVAPTGMSFSTLVRLQLAGEAFTEGQAVVARMLRDGADDGDVARAIAHAKAALYQLTTIR